MSSSLTRRCFLQTMSVASLSCLFNSCGLLDSAKKRPNIVFFLIDDQRNDTLGCAGHPIIKTPRIDDLARKGVRFTNAFVTTPICAASRATCFTGLYERTHQYTFGTPPLENQYIDNSYPILLRKSGYQTGFIGKFGVDVPQGTHEAMFDFFKPLDRNPYFHPMPDGSKRHETDLAADHAITFINTCKKENPFCLSVSFNAVHAEDSDKNNQFPFPPSSDGLYENITIPKPKLADNDIFESMPLFLKESLNRERYYWRWDTQEKYQKNMKDYFKMISGVDYAIGRVIDELENVGLADNTIIIYMGDNGYYMGDRGFAGKWSHFEESLRVPLIIYAPHLKPYNQNTVNDQMVLNVDVAPTIMELANISIPDMCEGRSLLPFIRDNNSPSERDDFFCEHLFDHPKIPKWEGVHGRRYVYARYFEQTPVYEFLHDLKVDPEELVNYAGKIEYQEILKNMRSRCDELKERYISKRSG